MQCLMAKPYKLFFIRCRIKILHQPFLLDFVKFSVLSLILGLISLSSSNSLRTLPVAFGLLSAC
ncbi:MAG TPA: hypothetical protein HPP56_08470 [Nitrospirae bacterium]|nr:hypothetical protein [Nitrospirota bacterium]